MRRPYDYKRFDYWRGTDELVHYVERNVVSPCLGSLKFLRWVMDGPVTCLTCAAEVSSVE
jgi:hypothetical protein